MMLIWDMPGPAATEKEWRRFLKRLRRVAEDDFDKAQLVHAEDLFADFMAQGREA